MKTILVPYHDEDAARDALQAAILLAKRFASHIQGLLVVAEPQVVLGAFVPGMAVPPEYLSRAAQEWRRFADGARTDFLKITSGSGLPFGELATTGDGPTAGWYETEGPEGQVVGEYGRVFDLIIIGRTRATSSSSWRDTCETALFESGRPVLVAAADAPQTIGRTVVVAWNGSVEGARTLALGMPLLREAARVEVVSVEGQMVVGPTAEDVAAHLRWHGFAVEARTLRAQGRPPGEVILEEVGDLGADLLLKGAFTRSRFRQIVFGGTTQHILDYARVPVLLAH